MKPCRSGGGHFIRRAGRRCSLLLHLPLLGALLLGSAAALAQGGGPGSEPAADDVQRQKPVEAKGTEGSQDTVTIEASRPWRFNRETRYAHSLPEVQGEMITVTKKTSVVKLDEQPTIIDNNQRELFDRLPGIVLAEQQNPTELNVSYRGLGNPQESEYVLLMQDGIPLELDWIGYPTTYYLPVPQTISSVQMIRAGSGLLYGPEPQPVINFISRAPDSAPFAGTSEQVGGTEALFSSFNRVSGTSGSWDYLADFSRRQSDGQRMNGDYALNTGDMELGYKLDPHQRLSLAVHAYSLESGLPGLMTGTQFHQDPNQTTTPDDRLWTGRYTAALTYENHFSEREVLTQKVWSGYADLITRSDAPSIAPTSATLARQQFHYTGLDGRFLHRWGSGNALTVGYTAYTSTSPYTEETSSNLLVDRGDHSGTPIYLDERSTRYGSVFAESVFRFSRFHVVTSARFDQERLWTHELVKTSHPNSLVNQAYDKGIPLFGLGIGNDFGRGNETYINVSRGFRPLRYLDISSPFGNFSSTNNPNPTKYLTYEAGVHGWPLLGFYYDLSLFQVNVRDRLESLQYSAIPGETIDMNTGDTRNRGIEAESSYDLLRLWGGTGNQQLTVFANASYLDARFTHSNLPNQIGKVPAYAPRYVLKAGVTLARDHVYKLSVVVDSVDKQYFQDSDLPLNTTPAQIPAYTIVDLAGDYEIAGQLRLLGGISNLTDRVYYSRVFLSRGMLEPARERNFYGGLAYDF